MNNALRELLAFQAKTWNLRGIASLLGWDSKTYMPPGGISARAQHASLMDGLVHERVTSDEYGRLLGSLIDLESGQVRDPSLNFQEQRLLTESVCDRKLAVALPNAFVQEFSEAGVQAERQWEIAREKDDYSLFAPHLERMIGLCKRKADYLALGTTPYDSLLYCYEPNATTVQLNHVFSDLRDETISLLSKLPECAQPHAAWLTADYDHAKQLELGRSLMKKMGANEQNIRLDLSTHPFCTTIHPSDIRITTRFGGLAEYIYTILHETGHALYEAGLPQEWYGSPLCEAISMGIHESQSRFWEVFIGKSRVFWETEFNLLKEAFPSQLSAVGFEEFYAASNPMGATLIRVGADELTYNLHIIIRFELEQQMINGTVNVSELPEMWNTKYRQYLGISPKSNREGILQDTHWSFGGIGYFPTYTLGNIYAAQWWKQIRKEMPDLDARIRAHDFVPILNWLKKKIHIVGRGQTSAELVRSITGGELSAWPLIDFLKERVQR